MKARIVWIGKNKSQQDSILNNGRYTTIVRFSGEAKEDWLKEAWSLDLTEFTPESEDVMLASVKFLSPDAPDRLYSGATFELYEGPKCIARGEVIA